MLMFDLYTYSSVAAYFLAIGTVYQYEFAFDRSMCLLNLLFGIIDALVSYANCLLEYIISFL